MSTRNFSEIAKRLKNLQPAIPYALQEQIRIQQSLPIMELKRLCETSPTSAGLRIANELANLSFFNEIKNVVKFDTFPMVETVRSAELFKEILPSIRPIFADIDNLGYVLKKLINKFDFDWGDIGFNADGTISVDGDFVEKDDFVEAAGEFSDSINDASLSIEQRMAILEEKIADLEKFKDEAGQPSTSKQKAKIKAVIFTICFILRLLALPATDRIRDEFLERAGVTEFWEQSGINEFIGDVFGHLFNFVPQGYFDPVSENVRKLESLFPSVVKDGEVDFDALREELGQFREVGAERYELTWAGKQAAKKLAQADVAGRTLKYVSEDSKDADTTQNLYIEGDNLEVLKLLRQNYYGAVKMIYIDPPYNTGNDFVYRDNFAETKQKSDEDEGETNDGERMVVNQGSSNRYHANWLNMMLPRLRVAKDLLSSDGVILINIDEHEVTNLQKLCEEIFGVENNLGTIVWDKRNPKGDARGVSYQHENIVLYAKNKEEFLANCKMQRPKKNAQSMLKKAEQIFKKVSLSFSLEDANKEYQAWIAQSNLNGGEKAYNRIDENGDVFQSVSMGWPNNKKAPDDYFVPLIHPITNKPCPVPPKGWRNPSTTMRELLEANLILFGKDETTQPRRKYLLRENMYENISSLLYYGGSDADMLAELEILFDTPKVVNIIKEHLQSFTGDDDIVLDFFSGSATTAHAVMQLNAEDGGNRRFIMVQWPEETAEKSEAYKAGYKNICEIGKERIRRAGDKIKAEVEKGNEQLKLGEEPKQVPDIGFKVFRTADTNIRWTQIALYSALDIEEGDLMLDYQGKDSLDFMPDFTDLDVVYEILLKQRDIPLSSRVEKLPHIGERTYLFADSYVVCLEETITPELMDALAAVEPTPISFILRDSAFDDDISLKDESLRRLKAYIARRSGEEKNPYTVEFI